MLFENKETVKSIHFEANLNLSLTEFNKSRLKFYMP